MRVRWLISCLVAAGALTSSAHAASPSFGARQDYLYSCSEEPGGLAVADFNNDGIPDMLCNTFVLLGNGNGTFREGPTFQTGFGSAAFVVADVNGDGNMDLISAGGPPAIPPSFCCIGVSLGNGDATFQVASSYPAGTETHLKSLAIGDFNGDHIIDVVTLGASGVWLFTGKGGGALNPGVLFPVAQAATYSFSISASDLNGDGKLDIVAAAGSGFAILLGNGDGTFQPPTYVTTPLIANGLTVGDLNGDGHPDIVAVGELSKGAAIYLGVGDGTFKTPTSTYLPQCLNVVIADIDGDGIPDLAGSGFGVTADIGALVAIGNGDGTFKNPQHYPVGPDGIQAIGSAVLLSNGRQDLIANNGYTISVLLNEGKGVMEDGNLTAVPGGVAGCAATADFNGDGKPDLAVGSGTGVSILLGTGKAAKPFTQGQQIPVANYGCLASGDFNADGIPDLLVVSASTYPLTTGIVTVFLGKGDGTFTQKTTFIVTQSGYPAIGDFNGDGKLDYALDSNVLGLGNGDGTFQAPAAFVPYIEPLTRGFSEIASADLNGDGKSDLVLPDTDHNYIYVLLSKASGGFRESVITAACPGPVISFADLNGDGALDMVTECGLDSGAGIYLNNGKGVFTAGPRITDPLNSDGAYPIVADLNGDGILDLAILDESDVSIFLGEGNLTFAAPFYIGTGAVPTLVMTGNFHGQSAASGTPDLVVPSAGGGVVVLTNLTK